MKKIAKITIVLTLLLSLSCKEKVEETTQGEVIGLSANSIALPRRGMNLTIGASRRNCQPTNYSFSIKHQNDTLSESIGVRNLALNKIGVISLSSPTGQSCDTIPSIAMGFVRMEDMYMGAFFPARNKQNTLTIHSFDPMTNIIKGSLDVTFVPELGSYGSSFYPDTFRLKCDAFTVQLK